MRSLLCCLILFFSTFAAEQKPTVAVLKLSGGGFAAEDLEGFSNRLRVELFETGAFTVVEREQMEAILKEQGFQQTGCTNAECAVEVGQMLNVQFMITGSLDKVGNIYTINLRKVDVESGENVLNVSADCIDCPLDRVVLQTVKEAAQKIAGIEVEKKEETALDTKRKIFKGSKEGWCGQISILTTPEDAAVFINDSLYGYGKMLIDSVPVGRYSIRAEKAPFDPKDTKISVYRDEVSSATFTLKNRRAYLCLRPSLQFGPHKFESQTATVLYTMTNGTPPPSLEHDITLPSSNQNNLGYLRGAFFAGLRGKRNCIGLSFNFWPTSSIHETPTFSNGASSLSAKYEITASNFGVFCDYSRILLNSVSAISIEPGLSLGYSYRAITAKLKEITGTNDPLVSYSTFKIDNIDTRGGVGDPNQMINSSDFICKISEVSFGGPTLRVSAGGNKAQFFIEYFLMLGFSYYERDIFESNTKKFMATNSIRTGLSLVL